MFASLVGQGKRTRALTCVEDGEALSQVGVPASLGIDFQV